MEQKNTIRLCHDDNVDIGIETNNGDRFLWAVQAVATACKAQEAFVEAGAQFRMLIKKLQEWLHIHGEDVREAYITIRDSGLLFLVVRKAKSFNETFEDALTELDIEVANNKEFSLIRLSVLALPATSSDAIQSFLAAEPEEVTDAE